MQAENRRDLRTLFGVVALAFLAPGCDDGSDKGPNTTPAEPSGPVVSDGRLDLLGIGTVPRAISYDGYRRGQRPGGLDPSYEQVAEDMHLLASHFDLIRVYGTGSHTETILEVLRGEGLGIKMMLGAWLGAEPDARVANQAQIVEAIALANAYSKTIVAVSVGNETLVDWSDHRIDEVDVVIDYVRKVKAGIAQPVTVADNFAVWRTGVGKRLAAELDFLTMHTYAQWEGYANGDALARTIENVKQVRAALPEAVIAIGEAGWTTQALGEPMMRGAEAHEYYQRVYRDTLLPWVESEGLTCFWFAAFDGPWKGGDNPGEPEKHWGLFTTDRVAKYAIYDLYPDRLPPEVERVTGPP